MSVETSIVDDLQGAFSPSHLSVANESNMHNVPAGSESHFKVVLVCDAFADMRKVARHQRVYQVLRAQLDAGVHALALHTYSPQEWQQRQAAAPESPDCLGGSKPPTS